MKALAGRGVILHDHFLLLIFSAETHSYPTSDFREKASLSPEGGGWFRPEEVIGGLGNPQDLSSTLPHLPPSAVNLVVALMGRNLCEVLSSLCPGTGADGRLALVGRTPEGIDGPGGNGGDRFRCSLEVAWDMKAGRIFVRRFVMEEDEKQPRCVIGSSLSIFEAVGFWRGGAVAVRIVLRFAVRRVGDHRPTLLSLTMLTPHFTPTYLAVILAMVMAYETKNEKNY